MKRLLPALLPCALAGLILLNVAAQNDAPSAKLEGSRPVIDASQYATLQAAFDAIPPEGGVVELPPGRFEIKEPLVLQGSDILVRGSGTATHIKNLNEEGKPALILRSRGDEKNKKERPWRVQLSDFRITGNPGSGHGIEARYVNEIYIDGVTCSYHGGDGIQLYYCYEDPRVCDSLLTYNKQTGLNVIGCHDIVVVGNHFEENRDAVRCVDGFNLCMTGNNLDDHLRHGVVIENTYGSVVSGNMIEECKGQGIVLDKNCYGITLSANVIAHEFSGGIDLADAHGCAVSANTFTIVRKHALRIGPGSGRITVSANNFSDSFIGPGDGERRAEKDQEARGIVLEDTSDVAINGNVFSGLDEQAVVVAGSKTRRVNFTGNVLKEVVSQHEDLEDSLVENNIDADD